MSENGCQVEVVDNKITVLMNPSDEQRTNVSRIAERAFNAAHSVVAVHDTSLHFYAAFDGDGALQKCVSISAEDRAELAGLVAAWIAEGYAVNKITAKEMGKHLRAIVASQKVVKEAANAAKETPADPAAPEHAESASGEPSGELVGEKNAAGSLI